MVENKENHDDLEKSVQRLTRFANLMEARWRIPFTRINFGLDFLLGLVPVLGDVLTGIISLWLVKEARKFRLRRRVYIKMVGNILVDMLLGALPVVGDLFDLLYKANQRNLNMIVTELNSVALASSR